MIGCKKKEVLGSDFRKYFDKDSRFLIEDVYIRREKGEKLPYKSQIYSVTKKGKVKSIKVNVSVIKHKKNKIETMIQLSDLTENRK